MTATKSAILFAHRWLGFISGLVVFVISVTGCIYCFQDEIQDVTNSYRKVEDRPFIRPWELIRLSLEKYPQGKITSVIYYSADRAPMVRRSVKKKVITGLSFSLSWVNKGLYSIANLGGNFSAEKRKFKSDSTATASYPEAGLVIDHAYEVAREKSPLATHFLFIPGANESSALLVTAYPQALHFSDNDNYAFDQYSGKLLNFLPYEKKSPGMKLNNMNYDIHTGQLAGFLGKIIAFLSSLVSATLPVTGLILYLGKKKKAKRKQKPILKPIISGNLIN
jgi:uncharacterized iron-regulated membrane protein